MILILRVTEMLNNDIMENCLKILEISVKLLAVITWPIVILIVFYILKEPLKKFISNIKRIGYGDAGIETEYTNKQTDDIEKSSIELLSKGKSIHSIDKTINLFSPETNDVFRKIVLSETVFDSSVTTEEKIELLLKYSQLIYLVLNFNKIYYSIYGSQLKLLERLNSNSFETKESIKYFYDIAKSVYAKTYERYTYENYLEFLINYKLIEIENTTAIKITAIGKDFLKYIIDNGLSMERIF